MATPDQNLNPVDPTAGNDPLGIGVVNPSVPTPPSTGTSDSGSPTTAAPPAGSTTPPPPTDPNAPPSNPTTDTSGLPSWLTSLFSNPTVDAGLGAALGLFGVNQASTSAQQTIAPLLNLGTSVAGTGQTLLGQGMAGTLTPAQQTAVTTAQTQGQTLIDAATPVGQIAQSLYNQYSSGTLKPADQATLDQQTAAAKQQVLQAVGGDSTLAATYFNQIDQQALQTKQKMLDSYLATGNTEFDQWSTTTQQGQAAILAGQQYAVTQIDNTFEKAFSALSLGGTAIASAVEAQIKENTALAAAFASYMGNIAKGYAQQTATNPASSLSGTIGSIIKKLTGGSNAAPGGAAAGADAAAGGAADLTGGGAGAGVLTGGATTDVSAGGVGAAGGADWTSGLGVDWGSISGGGAADVAGATDALGGLAGGALGAEAAGAYGALDAASAATVASDATAIGAETDSLLASQIAAEGGTAAPAAAAAPEAAGLFGGSSMGAGAALGTAAIALAPFLWATENETPSGNQLSAKYWTDLNAAAKAGDPGARLELASALSDPVFNSMTPDEQQIAIQLGITPIKPDPYYQSGLTGPAAPGQPQQAGN